MVFSLLLTNGYLIAQIGIYAAFLFCQKLFSFCLVYKCVRIETYRKCNILKFCSIRICVFIFAWNCPIFQQILCNVVDFWSYTYDCQIVFLFYLVSPLSLYVNSFSNVSHTVRQRGRYQSVWSCWKKFRPSVVFSVYVVVHFFWLCTGDRKSSNTLS